MILMTGVSGQGKPEIDQNKGRHVLSCNLATRASLSPVEGAASDRMDRIV